MTFQAALAQIEAAVREHGAKVEALVVRVKSGAISEAQFVAEIVSLRQAFESIVGELKRSGDFGGPLWNRKANAARGWNRDDPSRVSAA